MTIENPYETPRQIGADARANDGLLLRGGATIFVAAILGSVLGLLLGSALGYFVPAYYRSVIVGGRAPDFDPLAVGVGLGVTQGCFLGALCGLGVVGLHSWFRSHQRAEDRGIRG